MPLQISDFTNYFSQHGEVSKADKFDVWLTVPQSIQSTVSMQDLATQCEVASLPGRDIVMREYTQWSFQRRIPMHSQYHAIDLQFLCTGDLVEKKLFDAWMEVMVPSTTGFANYPIDDNGNAVYETDIWVNQYDQSANSNYGVILQGAMPISMQPMALDWSNDQVHRLQITFAFIKWISFNGIITSGASITGGGQYAPGQSMTGGGGYNLTNYLNQKIASLDKRLPPGLIPPLQAFGVPNIIQPSSISIPGLPASPIPSITSLF